MQLFAVALAASVAVILPAFGALILAVAMPKFLPVAGAEPSWLAN